eukprot:6209356-Pleurochrysis_carterae.AAC.1
MSAVFSCFRLPINTARRQQKHFGELCLHCEKTASCLYGRRACRLQSIEDKASADQEEACRTGTDVNLPLAIDSVLRRSQRR